MKELTRLQKAIILACGMIGEFAGLHIMTLEFSGASILGFFFFIWGSYYFWKALQ